MQARYVTGLSATVMRKDGHDPIIFMQCGPVRYQVDARTQAAKRPFSHRVIVRHTGFSYSEPATEESHVAIHDLFDALAEDETRNDMILADVTRVLQAGRSPLVLSERRAHLEHLAERLEGVAAHVIVLKGGMTQKQRRILAEKMAAIPDDEERLVLATGRYLGEGFDDSRLDTLFLTLPISWRGTLAQYAGRLHRTHEAKKEVLVYDYADLNVPMLNRMYQKRCRGYRGIGYEIDDSRAASLPGPF
jgi:superfamily II DNA or RNA helicase